MTKRLLYRSLLFSLLLPAALGTGSCRKALEVSPPSKDIEAGAVFANDAAAQTAMIGFYNQAMDNTGGILNGNISLYAGLSADELGCLNPRLPEDSFYINRLSAVYPLSGNLFSSAYTLIFSLNSVVASVSQSKGVTTATKATLKGEACFLRALLYFYLVNLYGGVPLVTGIDYNINARLPRASVDSVYQQMVSDLLFAEQSLPVDYVAAGAYAGNRTRPVQAAAAALLARVYLYQGQWARAAQAAGTVIADQRYLLEPALDSVFMATSREAIWQLQPVHDTIATADANFFLPKPFGPQRIMAPLYFLTPQLLGSIAPGDGRRLHWTGSSTIGARTYGYPYKYKQTAFHPGDAEYEMVLRLAEQHLIRAEARARLGDVAGAAADLNLVRARAGLPGTTATDQQSLLTAILAERRVELMTEWGHRWLDLKRTGQADTALGAKQGGWKPEDVLYPIPGYELLSNPTITQNPGY